MSKFSKDAFNISQDIYNLGGDLEKLNDSFNNYEITPNIYANNLYLTSCKIAYLTGIIEIMKQQGYNFSSYEKELTLLDSIIENIDKNFKISNMSGLTEEDLKNNLLDFTNKYNHLIPIDDEDDYDYELNQNLSF